MLSRAYPLVHVKGSLALEDMAGGSFTISNGGVFGSLMGTPIINPPQSAILGMHATKMRAVVGPDVSCCENSDETYFTCCDGLLRVL